MVGGQRASGNIHESQVYFMIICCMIICCMIICYMIIWAFIPPRTTTNAAFSLRLFQAIPLATPLIHLMFSPNFCKLTGV